MIRGITRLWRRRTYLLIAVALSLIMVPTWFAFQLGTLSIAIAQATRGRLIVDAAEKSFGTVVAGRERVINFYLTNRTNQPVTVVGANTSCGCTATGNLPLTIESAQTGQFQVTIATKSRRGPFAESVELYTDLVSQPQLMLQVTGRIIEPAPPSQGNDLLTGL